MKTLNLLVAKLYSNSKYGVDGKSAFHFRVAQVSVSLLVLLWVYPMIEISKVIFKMGLGASFKWLYIVLFFVIFYFLNKNTWSISQAEDFINDKENEAVLSRTMWVFWIALISVAIFAVGIKSFS